MDDVTCSIEGCDKPPATRGWCHGHYKRWRRYGNPTNRPIPPDDVRFWSKVDRSGVDGCWQWTGRLDVKGYGVAFYAGKHRKAHRVAWFLTYGEWPKLTLDHVYARGCRHRNCVNPAHLEDVSQGENTRRGTSFAVTNAAKTHCAKGHPFSGDNLRRSKRGARVCRTCVRASWDAFEAAAGEDALRLVITDLAVEEEAAEADVMAGLA